MVRCKTKQGDNWFCTHGCTVKALLGAQGKPSPEKDIGLFNRFILYGEQGGVKQPCNTERYSSGLRGRFAKALGAYKARMGSNPILSAT
jgi:hypothetical protein